MYAIVRAGGRQEKVAVGDVVVMDRVAGDPGTAIAMPALLLVDGSGHVRWRGSGGFGAPLAQDLDTALAAHRRG